MAQHGDETLRPYGKRISDAVDFYVKHLEATTRSVPLSVALNELIANRKASGASLRYCYDLGLRISRFCNDFPNRSVAEITTPDVDNWLAGLPLAAVHSQHVQA